MAAEVKGYLPSDWKDNDRMNFMFSAFPEHRNVNPKHWDSKLQFWTKVILDSCQHYGNICVDFETLRQRFTRNGLVPLGFQTVILEMLKTRDIQVTDEIRSAVNDGWISWSYGLAKKSIIWTAGTLLWGGDSRRCTIVEGEHLVVVNILKDKAEALLQIHYKNVEHEATDHILPWNVLKTRSAAGGLTLNDRDLDLVTCYLQKQKIIAVCITADGEKVIKFAKKNQSTAYSVTETDVDIMRLKKTVAVLTLQGKQLSNNIESCRQKAKTFMNEGLRKSALAVLKKRESCQRSLDKTMGNLHTLEELLHRIQEAETDKMIVDTLKSGSSALKSIQEGVNIKDVDKVMMDIEETLDDAEEIQQALAQGNKSIAEQAGDGDMDELERELEALSFSIGPERTPQQIKGSPPKYYGTDEAASFPLSGLTPPATSLTRASIQPVHNPAQPTSWVFPTPPTHSPSSSSEPSKKNKTSTAIFG